jgi:ABC-type branched-subunit amino acid transport system ATPase component
MQAFKVQGIEKDFGGVRAVAGVSLSFPRGKITGLVGPNGSGKSTLINLISGMIPWDAGAVIVGGTRVARMEAAHAPACGITRTFQDVRLFEQMSVLDNALITAGSRGVVAALFSAIPKAGYAAAENALREVGLWDKRGELAENLSYGQRKLLEISRAMLMARNEACSIVLFDEPFAGLFKHMVSAVADIIRGLRADGATIILVEHNMELIRALSDRVVVMDSGVVLAEGAPDEVLARKDVIEAYLGE